ncbi:PAS domain-containing protein [Frigidibacter oleivorans]|uniref:PAS domain-containing protein n=1 Tax=Frigidibacter oleivorans TaxID=2487129 RepID=UPI000F8E63C7|nr:PAS domain-containing protein [Frigidibacter oleivorans]
MPDNPFPRATAVIERSAVALTLADLEAEDSPLVAANGRFSDLTGYAAAQVLGRNCRFLQVPGENATERAEIRRAIAERTELQVILRNRRKDGSEFDNLLFLNPVRIGPHAYMLGSQFELADRAGARDGAPRHANLLADDIGRIMDKAGQLQMGYRRHLAETATFLVGRWAS